MKTIVHPWDKRGPNMMAGYDHDGNQVAIEMIDDQETMKDLLHYHMADAKRYRWLRNNAKEIVFKGVNGVFVYGSIDDKAEALDSDIDAAMGNLVEGPQMTATEVKQRIKDLTNTVS